MLYYLSTSTSIYVEIYLIQVIHTLYQLPTPKLEDGATEDQINSMYVFIWALSTIVPLVYLGHKRDESSAQVRYKGAMYYVI